MEDKKIQSLKKEIAKMEASYDKSSTPQSVKNILKKSIDAAKGRLEKMEAKPEPKKEEPKKEEPKAEPAKPKAKRKPSTALSKLIRRTKSKGYEPYKGKKIDLVRDAGKKAKAPGKKVSKTGRTYWESRPNRIDVKQKAKSAPYLKEGGELIKPMAAYGDMVYNTLENALSSMKRLVKPQNYTLIKSEANRFMVTTNNRAAKFVKQGWEYVSRMSNPLSDKFAYGGVMGYEEGGYMAEGGMEEHGLKIGDTVKSNLFWEDSITVKDKSGSLAKVELDKGKRFEMEKGGYMAEGGEMGGNGIDAHATAVGRFFVVSNEYTEKFKTGGNQKLQKIVGEDLYYKKGNDWWWNSPKIIAMTIPELKNLTKKIETSFAEGGYMAEGSEIELEIKNLDSFDNHYDEVEFTEEEVSLPYQKDGKWFVKTTDKGIARQLKQDGFVKDSFAKGGYMAEGGALEHGLQVGDRVMVVKDNIIGVMNDETGEQATIDISTGERKSSSGQSYESGGMLNKYEPVLGLKEDYWPGTSIPKVLLKTTIEYDKDRQAGIIGPEENWGYALVMETFKTAAPKYINIEYEKILKTTKRNNTTREEAEKIAEKVIPELKEKSISWVKENYDDIFWDVMAKKEKTGKESSGQSYASGGTISKSYEPIEGTQYELKVQVYYDKGGMNYFSGRPEARGYYASVSPVQVERRDNGIVVESYAAFSGVKQLLVETQRSSPKGEREAMQKAEEVIPQLKAHVIEKLRNKLGN